MARFTPDGVMVSYYLSAEPADPEAPTQAEITGGTNLVGTKQAEELVEIQGFEPSPSSLPTPGYAGALTGQVAGELTYPNAVMSWYKDTVSATIYDALPGGTTGFVFIGPDGLGVGEEGELFPIEVIARIRRKARNAPAIFDATMTTDVPYECTQAA